MVEKWDEEWSPGAEIVDTASCGRVRIYPMSLDHLERFPDVLAEALHECAAVGIPVADASDDSKVGSAVIKTLGPMLVSRFGRFLFECVAFEDSRVKVERVPHWDLALIGEKWIEINFGTGKEGEQRVRPWKALVARFTSDALSLLNFEDSKKPKPTGEPDAPRSDPPKAESAATMTPSEQLLRTSAREEVFRLSLLDAVANGTAPDEACLIAAGHHANFVSSHASTTNG